MHLCCQECVGSGVGACHEALLDRLLCSLASAHKHLGERNAEPCFHTHGGAAAQAGWWQRADLSPWTDVQVKI